MTRCSHKRWRMLAASVAFFVIVSGCVVWPTGLLPGPAADDDSTSDSDPSPTDSVLYVNLQIDAEREDVDGITRITEELKQRGIPATVYVTADYANQQALLVNGLYGDGFEIALHGFSTGEQLASMTLEEQRDLLTRARLAVEGCQPCGTYKPVLGFRPQYFSQNEDTYQVLDGLGFEYNSGFKAGQIYIEGHAEDAVPYPVDGHGFHAVPVSTIEQEGEGDGPYLCDIACANVLEMTGEQWGETLTAGLQQALDNGDPLVVLFHGWHTGDDAQYGYWQPFVDFLDQIEDQATFVTTQQLVDLHAE